MMMLGTLSGHGGSLPCLIGIEGSRVIVVAQDDLSRYTWPVGFVAMDQSMRSMSLTAAEETFIFTPHLKDRFRWVMTAALQEAEGRRIPWWRRRKAPSTRGLSRKLNTVRLAA